MDSYENKYVMWTMKMRPGYISSLNTKGKDFDNMDSYDTICNIWQPNDHSHL